MLKDCPICKIRLKSVLFYNTDVDYCPKCLGTFYDKDELRLAKDEKDKDLKWLDIDLWQDTAKFKFVYGIRTCPVCRVPLYEIYYGSAGSPQAGDSGLIVDVCNLCQGIWLDRAEFKKIIEYLKQKLNYEILHNFAENLRRETWEVFAGPEVFKDEVEDVLILLKFLTYKFAAQHPKIADLAIRWPK